MKYAYYEILTKFSCMSYSDFEGFGCENDAKTPCWLRPCSPSYITIYIYTLCLLTCLFYLYHIFLCLYSTAPMDSMQLQRGVRDWLIQEYIPLEKNECRGLHARQYRLVY